MKKENYTKTIFIFVATLATVTHTSIVYADDLFVPLTPGAEELGIKAGPIPNLADLVNEFFSRGIMILGFLAVIMVIIGGVKYMGTDSFAKKGEGKEIIKSAIGGLILGLSSWLILSTINPDLLNINISQNGFSFQQSGTNVTAVEIEYYSENSNSITVTNVADSASGNLERGYDPQNDAFIILPSYANIDAGTRVTVINKDTSRKIDAVVGGLENESYIAGTMSIKAARELGIWNEETNSINPSDIIYVVN